MKPIKDDGRAAKVHYGGQSRGGKDWLFGEDTGMEKTQEPLPVVKPKCELP